MFFGVSNLTYHSPITIEAFTCGVLLGMSKYASTRVSNSVAAVWTPEARRRRTVFRHSRNDHDGHSLCADSAPMGDERRRCLFEGVIR